MTAETITARDEAFVIRSTAHTVGPLDLRAAQWFQHGVTELDVARFMRAIELGHAPYRNRGNRWFMPASAPIYGLNFKTSFVVNEMIRTGLLRHYRNSSGDHLIPSPVHMRSLADALVSACLFVGEDMGPMRARLVDRLDLVDCLACEQAIATGTPRGL